jgi:hypothetical protein
MATYCLDAVLKDWLGECTDKLFDTDKPDTDKPVKTEPEFDRTAALALVVHGLAENAVNKCLQSPEFEDKVKAAVDKQVDSRMQLDYPTPKQLMGVVKEKLNQFTDTHTTGLKTFMKRRIAENEAVDSHVKGINERVQVYQQTVQESIEQHEQKMQELIEQHKREIQELIKQHTRDVNSWRPTVHKLMEETTKRKINEISESNTPDIPKCVLNLLLDQKTSFRKNTQTKFATGVSLTPKTLGLLKENGVICTEAKEKGLSCKLPVKWQKNQNFKAYVLNLIKAKRKKQKR